MSNLQRFILIDPKGKRIIGTDSGHAFTESAANQKCALLNTIKPEGKFQVKEIVPLLVALS